MLPSHARRQRRRRQLRRGVMSGGVRVAGKVAGWGSRYLWSRYRVDLGCRSNGQQHQLTVAGTSEGRCSRVDGVETPAAGFRTPLCSSSSVHIRRSQVDMEGGWMNRQSLL